MEEDVKLRDCCRICANNTSDLVSIYDTKHEDKNIAEILSYFLRKEVTENDGKPSNICLVCIPKLIESFELINLAKNSDTIFEQLVSSNLYHLQTSCAEPLVNLVTTEISGDLEDPLAHIKLENVCNEAQMDQLPSANCIKSRKRQRKFQCSVCGELHQSEQNLNQHLCDGQQVTCEYCSEVFHTTREILHHLDIHRDNWLSLECEQCKQSFKMVLLHSWHGKKHERFRFVCKICGKDFESRFSWHNHTRLVHNNKRPHICTICQKGFKDRSSLKKHHIMHSDERPFACSECSRRFRRQGGLTAHMITHQQIHSGDKISEEKSNDEESSETNIHAVEIVNIKVEEDPMADCNQEIVIPVEIELTENDNENAAQNPLKCIVCGEILNDRYIYDRHLCQGNEVTCEYCNVVYQTTNEILQHLEIHAENIFHFDCNRCSTSFKMKRLRDWHEMQHNRFLFDCEICGKRFETRRTLITHTRVVHSDERPFRCAECGKGFKEKSTLKKHYIRHTNERLFACPECPRRFFWQSNLAAHMYTHRKETHVCHVCGFVTSCRTKLSEHQKMHSAQEMAEGNSGLVYSDQTVRGILLAREQNPSTLPTDAENVKELQKTEREKTYECFVCHQQTHLLKRLKGHLRKHNRIKPFKCSICEERYDEKSRYDRHLCEGTDIKCEYCSVVCQTTRDVLAHLETHKDNVLLYKCVRCSNSFKMKNLFDWHRMQHDRMAFVCKVCDKRFGTRRTLTNHTRFVHTDERPHLCAECGKGFKQKCALQKHAVAHSNDKPFSCPHCPKCFPRLGNLKGHIQTHRIEKHVCLTCGIVKDSALKLRTHQIYHGERTHECEVCGYKFYTKYSLTTHMRTHTGEKPFMCEFCPAAYAQKNVLVKHLRTHIGDKTYVCERCNTSFRYYADLRKHSLYCDMNQSDQTISSINEVSTTESNVDGN